MERRRGKEALVRPVATRAERDEDRRRRREAALALRQHMSPLQPAPDRFRVATWNVNSLKARSTALRRFLERARPDVLCLQETKASDVAPAAADIFDEFGYTTVHAGAGAYNGVAIASLHAISDVTASAGFDDVHLDREPRREQADAVRDRHPPARAHRGRGAC